MSLTVMHERVIVITLALVLLQQLQQQWVRFFFQIVWFLYDHFAFISVPLLSKSCGLRFLLCESLLVSCLR